MTSSASRAGSLRCSRRSFFVACSLAPLARPALAEQATIEILQFAFAPTEAEVAVGATVTFTNLDLVPHTATGKGFDTGSLNKGESRVITFSEAGDFPYLCAFHRHMKGRILVR
jgi:plastocyanin